MGSSILAQFPLLQGIVTLAFWALALALLLCTLRVIIGPTLADRAIALDAISTIVMALIVLYCMKQGSELHMSAVLVIAIIGFIGMVVLSKYIHRGNIVYPLSKFDREDKREGGDF